MDDLNMLWGRERLKKEDKRAADCCREVFLCFGLYVVVGMATWSEADRTTGPHQKKKNPRCGGLVLGLFVGGPGGRNYTRDDPVLLGPPAFQVGFTFVARLWFYPPPSVATTELIPLMSSYSGHHIATPHTWRM